MAWTLSRGTVITLLVLAASPASHEIGGTPLPAPTGGFAVGTTVFTLTDSGRVDSLGRGSAYRQLNVQLWYPTSTVRKGNARSIRHRAAFGAGAAGVPGLRPRFCNAQALDCYAYARVAECSTKAWALSCARVVTRSGYGARELYVAGGGTGELWVRIVAIDHPHSGLAALPNGSIVSADDLGDAVNSASATRRRTADEARDVSVILDHLATRTVPPIAAAVGAAVDWQRAGAFGHSSGGLIAVEACNRDPRLRACVDMDGGLTTPEGEPMAEFVTGGVTKPTMILRSQPIYSDEDHARRGRTRAQWEASGRKGLEALNSLAAKGSAPLYIGSVAGTGHFSFSDGPFTMPTTITRFGGKIMEPARGWKIITTTVRDFFAAYLGGDSVRFPGDLTSRFTELTMRQANGS